MSDIRAEGRPLGVPLAGVPVPSRVARAVELARQGVSVGETQNTQKPMGLECPDCGCRHLLCVMTRQKPKYVYRRKQCRACGRMMSTTERIVG